jgi:phenylacetate-coenzyme A ligase PaaK-like adenylate-forming protein
MTEMGYGGAVACEARDGYHLREADLFVEVVDPETGRGVPDGVSGEVVFTTLAVSAMPLIRYRTGDLAHFLPEPCPCGSRLRRLGKIAGRRASGAVIGQSIRLTISALDEAIGRGLLTIEAVRLGTGKEASSGAAKRIIVDRRQEGAVP